jgi:uncharacterized protein YndB with AHSA1/START domain
LEGLNKSMNSELDLTLDRQLDATPEQIWRAWSDPELLKQWFAPLPYRTTEAVVQLHNGGTFATTMQSPEGESMSGEGLFLSVEPHKRIVFTDALNGECRPNPEPFMTVEITLEPVGNKTRYHVTVLHATAEAKQKHDEMGFHSGWGTCIDQLDQLAKTL